MGHDMGHDMGGRDLPRPGGSILVIVITARMCVILRIISYARRGGWGARVEEKTLSR